MRLAWVVVAVVEAACGRLGFDAQLDGSSDSDFDDAPANMTAEACPVLPVTGTTMTVTNVQDLRTALNTAAPANSTILVADGLYTTTTSILITRGHTVRSASGDASKVIFDGMGMADGVFRLESSGASLISLTVRNAVNDGTRVESTVGTDITDNLIYDITFTTHPGSGIRIRSANGVLTGPFADSGEIACSRFITDPADCAGGTGSSGVSGDAARGWTIRNNVFDKRQCTVPSVRTVWFDTGSRDIDIISNLFLDTDYAIFAGGEPTQRTYADPLPIGCSGVPDFWGGLICNNVIASAAVVPEADEDFEEGIALWNACDTWAMHNTIVSPSPAETYSALEYRYAGTYVHFVNNVVGEAALEREGAIQDTTYANSNYVYSSHSEFVGAAGADLRFAGTPPTGAAITRCMTDAAGKARNAAAPAVGAYEP